MTEEKVKKIGKYIVEKMIGRGAMGVVYLAKDPTIGRYVAIKCINIPNGLDDDKIVEYRERFLREARAAGILNHPNIVTIYDANEGQGKSPPYIVMEYIEGETWNRILKKGETFNAAELFYYLRDVASALSYAHKMGIIHRDIKPGNIISTFDGRVKLMDFGIARVPTSDLTREGQFLGTPAYMSPEQVMGKPVDNTSDLFSLGIVAYEMLTGRKPFDGEEVTTVLHKIVSEEPADICEIRREIPQEASAIIKKLLNKKREDRYQNAGELITDIDAFLAGEIPPNAYHLVEEVKEKDDKGGEKVKEIEVKKGQGSKTIYIGVFSVIALFILGLSIFILMFMKSSRKEKEYKVLPDEIVKKEEKTLIEEQKEIPGLEIKREDILLDSKVAAKEEGKEIGQEKKEKTQEKKVEKMRTENKKALPPKESDNGQNILKEQRVTEGKLAKLTFHFDFGSTQKGEAKIFIDDVEVRKTLISRSLLEKKEIWSDSIEVKPGVRKIKAFYASHIMGFVATKEEEKEFKEGEVLNLKIKLLKMNKGLKFEWGE